MSGDSDPNINGDAMEKLQTLQVSSFKDEAEEDEEQYDDMDEEDDQGEPVSVTLGFVEKPKNGWSILRQVFPSKAGGVPAWLDPDNLPTGQSSLCDFCGEPLQFLLQVYAPISEKESTFHRTLFVFMCTSMACLLKDQHEQWRRQPVQASRSIKVFRSQLPRCNPFYSEIPPMYDGRDKPSGVGAALCTWCGSWKGDKLCSRCKRARYCSEKHQLLHWHSGHRDDCQQMVNSLNLDSNPSQIGDISANISKAASKNLWPEYEILCEDEFELDAEISQDNRYSDSLISRDKMDETVNSLLDSFGGDDDKESWAFFQERITKAPEQVLRYSRNARAGILWPMSSGQPSKDDIPKCSHCGGLRNYEFQILPQLLYYFQVKNDSNSLDWATIIVYTCEASCEANFSYKEEFAWVQLSSPSAVVPP